MRMQAISIDMITAALDKMELKYQVEDNDDNIFINIGFEDCLYRVLLHGPKSDTLVIFSQQEFQVGEDSLDVVLEAMNEWNRLKLLPKVYPQRNDDGNIICCGECAWDMEAGINEEQLIDLLHWGLSTGGDLGKQMRETLSEYIIEGKDK